MSHKSKLSTAFRLQGQFLGFAPHPKHPFKYLRLSQPYSQLHSQPTSDQGELVIKLKKWLQLDAVRLLTIGDWLEVTVEQTEKSDGSLQYKGYQFSRCPAPDVALVAVPSGIASTSPAQQLAQHSGVPNLLFPLPAQPSPVTSPVKILICGKSSCLKRGGTQICQALEAQIARQSLGDRVQIKLTGCMDRCKQGPNLVFMPEKARYSQVQAQDIPALLQERIC